MLESGAPLPRNDGPRNLRDIFNAEADRAVADFPELRGRFAVVNVPDQEWYGSVDAERAGFSSERVLNAFLAHMARQSDEHKSSIATRSPRHDFNVIVYNPLPFKLFAGPDDAPEVEALAVFDHELGHLVVGGGFDSKDPCYRECAADTFAMLRNIQRFGEDSTAIRRGGWRRAYDFVMSGSAMHFTTLAIDEIDRLKHRIDFAAMTPSQTRLLAMRIALENVPHPDIINSVANSFSPVREALRRTGSMETALRALADITLGNENAFYIFRIGSRVLEPFLKGGIQTAQGPRRLEGAYWDDVRRKMDAHMRRLDSDGILIGIPQKGRAAANEDKPAHSYPPVLRK